MTRRAPFRQCDVAHVIRAARAAGAARVLVRPDGTIAIQLTPEPEAPSPFIWQEEPPTRRGKEIVL